MITGPRSSVPKDASVRMKCILALKALYEKRESAMKLGLFFYKFKVSEILCVVAVPPVAGARCPRTQASRGMCGSGAVSRSRRLA